MSNGSSGAFGRLPTSNTRIVNGVETRADSHATLEGRPGDLRERLSEDTAKALSVFQFFIASAAPDTHRWNSGAAGMVLNHAINDVLSLLEEVISGSGRSAARTARSMLEHLVNYADVTASEDVAQRYEAHRHVTADLIGRRGLYHRSPKGARQPQTTKEQRQMLRHSRQPLADALRVYGERFRRGFTPATLKDRAEQHGYADAYDGYRILSGVMHGAAGGLIGTRDTINGAIVHRTGPDLRLAEIAYIEGLTWWCQLLERVVDRGTTSRIDALLAASQHLRDAWPEVSNGLRAMDRDLWPTAPPTPVLTVLAFYPAGERWYVHRPIEETLTLAVPPSGVEADPALEEARQLYAGYRPELFGGRPMTVYLPNITVEEARGAPSVPSAGILVPAEYRSTR